MVDGADAGFAFLKRSINDADSVTLVVTPLCPDVYGHTIEIFKITT